MSKKAYIELLWNQYDAMTGATLKQKAALIEKIRKLESQG